MSARKESNPSCTRAERFDVAHFSIAGYESLVVRAGRKRSKRIVPPAGPDHAFDVAVWTRRVEVSVSPTGRSVRVWIDGEEVTRSSKRASS